MKIRWLDAAVTDLQDIRDYIGHDNPQAAQSVALRLREAINALAAHPGTGRPGRVSETRELVIPQLPYLIPYRVLNNTIEILRILHTAQQWPPVDSH